MERTRAILKAFFQTGDTPSEAQYIDLIDSIVNFIDDRLKIAINLYRSGSKVLIKDIEVQITFSSVLDNNNYEIIPIDPNGVGWENINDKLVTGFKITGLSNGTIGYLVILNN